MTNSQPLLILDLEFGAQSTIGALSNDDVNNNVRKTIGFMSKATALHVHHTYEYSLKFTARLRRETSECDVLWRTWTYCDSFSLLYLNMDKAVKNSIPGKVAYI